MLEIELRFVKEELEAKVAAGEALCAIDLRRADLQGAKLCKAKLMKANLRGANLSKANLEALICTMQTYARPT